MEMITIPKESFVKILSGVEVLIRDFEEVSIPESKAIKKRIKEIEADPSIGKAEQELDNYLKKRGIKVDRLDN